MMSENTPNKIPDDEGAERDEAKSPRTLWHPAVVRAIEFELEDCRDDLAIEAEYQLTTEPLRIDVLIIKKKRDVILKNSNCKQPMISATENTEFHGKIKKRNKKIFLKMFFHCCYSNSVFFRVFRGE